MTFQSPSILYLNLTTCNSTCKITTHIYGYLALNLAFISPSIYCWFPPRHLGVRISWGDMAGGGLWVTWHQHGRHAESPPWWPPPPSVRPHATLHATQQSRGHGAPQRVPGLSCNSSYVAGLRVKPRSAFLQIFFVSALLPKYKVYYQVYTIFLKRLFLYHDKNERCNCLNLIKNTRRKEVRRHWGRSVKELSSKPWAPAKQKTGEEEKKC